MYTIKPGETPMIVYCDMDTDGGGWTLFAGIRSNYSGEHFHVFDDVSATESSNSKSFHIKTTDLLLISKEIRVATDISSKDFMRPSWPNSAACQIPKELRADIAMTRSQKNTIPLKSIRATCRLISGTETEPNSVAYCMSKKHSMGFKMGYSKYRVGASTKHFRNTSWITWSYEGAPEGFELPAVPGVKLGGETRNGVLFLR